MVEHGKIYFDYAAATPLDPQVKRAMEPYWQDRFYNASALYQPAREVRSAMEKARAEVAKVLSALPTEIIFTAGATESINLAIQGVLKAAAGNIIIGAGEHSAVTESAQLAAKEVRVCPLNPSGIIDINKLSQLIDKQTVLISVQYANNEVGAIQPIHKISQLIKQKLSKRRNNLPLYLHSDGSQAPNYLPVNVNRLGVDLLTLNGSKIYGPKYSGCLYVRRQTTIKPIIVGGGQELGIRGGTENVAGAVGFSKAMQIADQLRAKEAKRLSQLQAYAIQEILNRVPGSSLNGGQKPRLPNNINFSIKGINGETLVHYLDQAGFLVATGAACNANEDKPSATLQALGLSSQEINSSLRITMGRQTTKAMVTKLITELAETTRLLHIQA